MWGLQPAPGPQEIIYNPLMFWYSLVSLADLVHEISFVETLVNLLTHGEGPLVFCRLLKKSSDDPYLKILGYPVQK